ncbi:hypothetical protein U9M48_034962 [Paspalum notatum var. saurae]|uniref:UBC core domain-containing protein n=1 Tax=Paspalum notatum var. saurae TaxID=547442 RepID=A0AAQ3UB14_PASNO
MPPMKDSMGQGICPWDTVMFNTTTTTTTTAAGGGGIGAHQCRGRAMRSVKGFKVSVLCIDGTEEAKKACDLTVVDRSYLCPGMAVTLESNPGGQAGFVTGATTALDLAVQLDGGELAIVATGVTEAEVRQVTALSVGDYVVSSGGAWLGQVAETSVDVDVLFDDGSVCRVAGAAGKLRRVSAGAGKGDDDEAAVDVCFYPGRTVAGDASVFKASRWIKGHWKKAALRLRGERDELQGTVAKVEMGGALVAWVASSSGGLHQQQQQSMTEPPAAYQANPRSLTWFCSGDIVSRWFWLVGHRCVYRHPPDAAAKKKKKMMRMEAKGIIRMRRRGRRRLAEETTIMFVANTRTTVDVVWQDGTRQCGVPSASLRWLECGEKDFFPGQRVIRSMPAAAAAAAVGVVKSLDYRDQTVRVSWIAAPGEEVDGVGDTVVMSAFHLRRSPDHEFFLGDIVVRQQPADGHLSWVGHVVDLGDAHCLQVKWGDGNTSKVSFGEIAFVKRGSSDEVLQEMGEWVDQGVDGGEDALDDKAHQERRPADTTTACDNNNDDDARDEGDDSDARSSTDEDVVSTNEGAVTLSLFMGWRGIIGTTVIQAAILMLARQGKRYLGALAPSVAFLLRTQQPPPAADEGMEESSAAPTQVEEEEAATPAIDATGSDNDETFYHFLRFEVVPQSPQDHHYYVDNMDQGRGKKWLKRVQKEWKMLGNNNLPDTIYVRAFEDRMDLLRAVVVGASGTPYHDGLFFFDLQLPPSYPADPPLVNYRSFGLNVNPNLYPSGTVCLSLLDTFGGKDGELWSPETSSVLQIVVSIQGLVLCPALLQRARLRGSGPHGGGPPQ